MLLKHLTATLCVPTERVDFDALTATNVSGFLDHLEHDRGNNAKTRNTRLTAIRAVLSRALPDYPEHAATITQVLAIPPKRATRPVIEFLTPEEVDALLAAPDRQTWTGRRDYALLAMAVQTGLRISEICALTLNDIYLGAGPHATCTGKGRRQRSTPLTRTTVNTMKHYLAVIRYIEGFYSSRRRHSALGYRRPNEVHYGYQQPALTAYRKTLIPLSEIPAAAHTIFAL